MHFNLEVLTEIPIQTAFPEALSFSVIPQDFMVLEAVEDNCVTCHQPVKEDEAALSCDLCERWEHMACI